MHFTGRIAIICHLSLTYIDLLRIDEFHLYYELVLPELLDPDCRTAFWGPAVETSPFCRKCKQRRNMVKKSNYSFQKHEREKIRQKKKQEKEARKQAARERKAAGNGAGDDVDPDIEGIVPDPQPFKGSEQ